MTIEVGDIVEFIGMRHYQNGVPVVGFVIDKDKDYALVEWFKDPRAIEIGRGSDHSKWTNIAYLRLISEDVDLVGQLIT